MNMKENRNAITRRQLLAGSGLSLVSFVRGQPAAPAPRAPATPVSIVKCVNYVGGIGKLAAGKTVAIKLNLTGGGRIGSYTAGQTHWVHPTLVGAACHPASFHLRGRCRRRRAQ